MWNADCRYKCPLVLHVEIFVLCCIQNAHVFSALMQRREPAARAGGGNECYSSSKLLWCSSLVHALITASFVLPLWSWLVDKMQHWGILTHFLKKRSCHLNILKSFTLQMKQWPSPTRSLTGINDFASLLIFARFIPFKLFVIFKRKKMFQALFTWFFCHGF